MISTASYRSRRGELETYFDRTAVDAWARLTSDAPVSRIRATVRAGRDEMRRTLLSWLPADLRGQRILDSGCGTGSLAVQAARRGAQVVAVDLSPTLIELARERVPRDLGEGSVEFRVGDMLATDLGRFDHVVAMDSLIHYQADDVLRALSALAARSEKSLLFTFAPRTPLLGAMHAIGRMFPRGDRAPMIEPLHPGRLHARIANAPELSAWRALNSARIARGFYISQAAGLVRQ